MSALTLILILLIVVIAAVAVWFYQRERTRKLRVKFGPEYDRLLQQEGSARRAEAVLESRQKRVEKLNIRALSFEEGARLEAEWRRIQEYFVDDPRQAVAEADRVISEAMRLRGYPMGAFEERAADISVEHPAVVEDYRAAHNVAMADQQGRATTEDLRRAMQHYRNLFERILNRQIVPHEEVHR